MLETNTTKKLRYKTLTYVMLLALFLAGTVATIIYFKVPAAALIPIKLFQGLAGTSLLILLAASVTPSRISSVLTTVGIASLAIFLLHPYFQGLSRLIVSHIAGETNSVAILLSVIVQTIAGVWGAIVIYFTTQRYGGTWLFYFPQKSKTSVPALSKVS